MNIVIRHSIKDSDLVKAVQAIDLDNQTNMDVPAKFTKANIMKMVRFLYHQHGDEVKEKEIASMGEVVSDKEALEIVKKAFGK